MTTHTPEELGCLVGGPARAAEVALARLIDAGLVRVSREGVVTAVHAQGRVSPLEGQILAGLRTGRSLPDVLRTAAASPEAEGLRVHLADRGLLRHRRSYRPRLYPWLRLAGIVLVVVGFLDAVAPEVVAPVMSVVGGLVPDWIFFGAGVVLLLWSAVLSARDPGRLRTREGHLAAKRARRRVGAQDRLGSVAVRGLRGRVGGVAVAGMFGLSAAAVATLPARDASSSSSCGGGCSSSSCGGGDGGGDGGSGCGGGCGGGGGD
ncbi:TIGR04222 domain-containing membrane protein [Lentzea sp.]|uniref:TIGR04222 domain-containing membrane protein n=1 Tax=Lentzea sp. TaxID=56099 RepID=UPI002ED1B03D